MDALTIREKVVNSVVEYICNNLSHATTRITTKTHINFKKHIKHQEVRGNVGCLLHHRLFELHYAFGFVDLYYVQNIKFIYC